MFPAAVSRPLCALAVAFAGCLGAPTPLSPSVRGSVGAPFRGALSGALALPRGGEGFKRLRDDDIRWGNPRLVHAIMRAARTVALLRPGGAPLVIGDLSARHGGRIPNHHSHRTGRDADLLFYAKTPDGRPVENDAFAAFGKDALAQARHHPPSFIRLDVERMWLLVRELSRDEEAAAQHLFIARWLEALLIEHALALGESDATIWRAATLMHEPGDSFVHDDHLHLRIDCVPAEIAEGCVPGPGPLPPGRTPEEPDERRIAALVDDPQAMR